MIKKLQLIIMVVTLGFSSLNAQVYEAAPYSDQEQQIVQQRDSEALFDHIFNIDLGPTALASMVGILFINDQYWISQWNSNLMAVLDNTGTLIETFSIPGVTGIRSITTNGTNIFLGGASTQIFEVDPVTRVLISTINITTTSDAEARMCTYDETLDGGNGGFWIGDFGSDIASVDMNGAELSVIPAATHNTVIYGGVIDNVSPGGPFLWIHDQSGTNPNQDFITQLDPATGVPTGVQYDYTVNAPAGNIAVLAGGLSISSEVAVDKIALLGICQCDPANQIFAIELVDNTTGINDNELANLSIYPNPTSDDIINIKSDLNGNMQVEIYNILGAKVASDVISNSEMNISGLNSGIYMVKVTQNEKSGIRKLVIK